jgi:hypothetical protein
MKIFLAHASEDRTTADSVAFSLRSRGHRVFLDRDDLPPGASYDQRIERAIKGSGIFIFLISPDSVTGGRFTLTELQFARQTWPDPNGRVLPVMVRKTPLQQVPSYLKAVTILEPAGDITAETSAAVDQMRRPEVGPRLIAGGAAGVAVLALATWLVPHNGAVTPIDTTKVTSIQDPPDNTKGTSPQKPIDNGTTPELPRPIITNAHIELLAGPPQTTKVFATHLTDLKNAGYQVREAKILDDSGRPNTREIRYFNSQAQAQAEQLAAYFKAPVKKLNDDKVTPGYIEIWLGR